MEGYDACAGFGDSATDCVILGRVGLPVTFPNGSDDVKGLVVTKKGIQSKLPHGFGTIDTLYRIMEHNIYLREGRTRMKYTLQ